MSYDRSAVRGVLDAARLEGRPALAAPEAKRVCEAYGIPVPREGLAHSAAEAASVAGEIGYPVVLKIVSPDILHKTEAGGVLTAVSSAHEAASGYESVLENARRFNAGARIEGVQVQRMLPGGLEVIVGATTDPSFGKIVVFGLGGVLVEVLKDVTFRLAPASTEEALSMLDSVAAADVLRGVRGAAPADRQALASIIQRVSDLVMDFPEIAELDLNPVLATGDGATAVDVRVMLDFDPPARPPRFSQEDMLRVMNRIMRPEAIAVIGASAEDGKIGNSVMKNLINGGYEGTIYPINPRADEILGRTCYRSVADVPGEVDVAVFAIPAKLVPAAMAEVGRKGIPGAVLIPSGFAETGNVDLQREVVEVA
ncbi:MAG: acetate--CoA ligase family protein, partial [Chloroflexota bacterium]